MKTSVKGILREIDRLGENDYKVTEYFKNKFPCIGNGSSRKVYAINEYWVAKVAKNALGKMQNSAEYDIYLYSYDKRHLGVVHHRCHRDNTVIFMKRYEKISKQCAKFKRSFNETFCQRSVILSKHEFKPMYRFMKYIEDNKRDIIELIDLDLSADLHKNNIAYDKRTKRLVLIDYGCTREISKIYIWKQHRYSKAMRKLINETNEHYNAFQFYEHDIFK